MEKNTKYKMEELSIEITYACPMNCIHCSSSAGQQNEIFIPKEKIIEMIDDCAENCGTECVSLSGGEPFEHPNFWEILEYIKSKGLKSIVYSCGIQKNPYYINEKDGSDPLWVSEFRSFTYDRLVKLTEFCDVLIISLHGTSTKHNKIMNIEGNAFGYALQTMKDAKEYYIDVETHFVPTKVNYKDVKIVYGICVALGVKKMSILRYVPQGRGLKTEKEGDELNLTKQEFMELNADMLYLKELPKTINHGSYKYNDTLFRIGIPADFTFLFDYVVGNKNAKKERSCTGGKTKILVKADGLVQVCPAWKELDHLSAGNIYEENIVDIWEKGNTYCKFREFVAKDLKEPCKSCELVESCLGGCAAQRILDTTCDISGLKEAPDPLCFIEELSNAEFGNELVEDVKMLYKMNSKKLYDEDKHVKQQ